MADMFAPADPYSLDAQRIARARKFAEALQQQGTTAIDPNRMAGGWVVPIQKGEGLSKIAQALLGAYAGQKTDQQQAELAQKNQADRTGSMDAFVNALKGTPARAEVPVPSEEAGGGPGRAAMPAVAGNPMAAYGELMKSQDPSLQQMGMRGIVDSSKPMVLGRSLVNPQGQTLAVDETWKKEQDMAREAKVAEQQAARQQRMEELNLRLQDQRLNNEQRATLQRELQENQIQSRRDMMQMAAGMRQAPQPQVIQTDNGPMILGRDGQAQPITGPGGEIIKGKGTEKALPTSAAQKLMENQQNLRRAEQALELINGRNVGEAKGSSSATGVKGYLPDAILQRIDKEGVDTRAAIGDLGSLVIHDRSGAAVTASEFPRLRPFIPQSTDNPEVVKKKLSRFVQEYRNTVNEATDFYKESGYKVPAETLRSGTDRRGVERRAPSAPEGIDAKLWGAMTPEERALWK